MNTVGTARSIPDLPSENNDIIELPEEAWDMPQMKSANCIIPQSKSTTKFLQSSTVIESQQQNHIKYFDMDFSIRKIVEEFTKEFEYYFPENCETSLLLFE